MYSGNLSQQFYSNGQRNSTGSVQLGVIRNGLAVWRPGLIALSSGREGLDKFSYGAPFFFFFYNLFHVCDLWQILHSKAIQARKEIAARVSDKLPGRTGNQQQQA